MEETFEEEKTMQKTLNTMAKRKRRKRQRIVDVTLHRKLKVEEYEPH